MNHQRNKTIFSLNKVKPTSVLVIDDSRRFREEIISTLRKAALFDNYFRAKDGLEGFKSLTASPADVVICDPEMPHMDGHRFLQMVNAQTELLDIPIIILTGNHSQKAKLQGLEEGANDYLTKPCDDAELVARVKIQLKTKKLRDELKAANNYFKQLSDLDPVTNLNNRRSLTEKLDSELHRARRIRSSLCLLIVDIDHFKEVNDIYGHQKGDEVLIAVTEAIRKGIRPYDIASRYGGDEFVLILPDTSIAEGIEVAGRLLKAVQSLDFKIPTGSITLTVSIGIAEFPAVEFDGSYLLLQRADQALYCAKKNGRNRVEAIGRIG